ncbi:channel protein TolC, partial [Leptospira kemamanensis]
MSNFQLAGEVVYFTDLPKLVGEKSYELKLKEIEIQRKKVDIDSKNLRYLPSVNLDHIPFFESLRGDGYNRKGWNTTLNLNWNFQEQGNAVFTNLILELEYERLLLEYRALYQKELFDQAFQYAETLKLLAFYDYDFSNESDADKQFQTVQKLYKQGIESYLVTQNSKVDYFFYKYNAIKSRLDQQKSQSIFRRKFLLKDVTLKQIPEREYKILPLEETLK